jgi:hypothetical protein
VIIAGFPGVGKSHIANNSSDGLVTIHDSDSSKFSWIEPGVRHPEWPGNYIDHIRSIDGPDALVFVSTHIEVRAALVSAGLAFATVIPNPADKETYLTRCLEHGSPPEFIELISANWSSWLRDLARAAPASAMTFQLNRGAYLADQLGDIQRLFVERVGEIDKGSKVTGASSSGSQSQLTHGSTLRRVHKIELNPDDPNPTQTVENFPIDKPIEFMEFDTLDLDRGGHR